MNDSAIPVKYGEEQTPGRENKSVYDYEGNQACGFDHEKRTSSFSIKKIAYISLVI
jgi:hypothetical protein